MIQLIHGDCNKYLAGCKDKQFSLGIVDPPYRSDTDQLQRINNFNGSKKSFIKAKATTCKEYDYTSLEENVPKEEYFIDLKRVCKNQIVWGYNYFAQFLGTCRGPIVWDKQTTGYLADAELAYNSIDRNMKIFQFMWNGMLQGNMSDKENRTHPTQKPVQLYKWLLKNYTKEGDTILDTHGGSMSSVIACIDGGFDMTCIELDPDYFEAGVKRVQNHVKQLDMFIERPEIKIIEL